MILGLSYNFPFKINKIVQPWTFEFQSVPHLCLRSCKFLSTTQNHSKIFPKSRQNTQNGQLRVLQRKGMARSTVSQSLCWKCPLHVSLLKYSPKFEFQFDEFSITEPTEISWEKNCNRWPRNYNAQQIFWWKRKTTQSGFSTKSTAE